MNKLAKWAFSVTLLVAANLGFASDENTRMLEVHARECIDFLQAFATEDFNPQKALRTNFENGFTVTLSDCQTPSTEEAEGGIHEYLVLELK